MQTALLISIISSGMLFMHKHTTSSGKIVIHVHPYDLSKGADGTKHHHTDNEIHFLDVVFHGSFLQTDFAVLDDPFVSFLEETNAIREPEAVSNSVYPTSLPRAPPSV